MQGISVTKKTIMAFKRLLEFFIDPDEGIEICNTLLRDFAKRKKYKKSYREKTIRFLQLLIAGFTVMKVKK